MRYKKFGNTNLETSEIGFGCARLGGILQNGTKGEMLATLRKSLDAGITFYDTSDMYCQGESEKLLGEAFRHQREKVIIASKGGYVLPAQRRLAATIKPCLKIVARCLGIKRQHLPVGMTGTLAQNFAPEYLLKAVEGSLRRLNTDYLDLYQLHSPPLSIIESGEFIQVMEKLKGQGKIRYYGVSCETAEDALACLVYPGISSLQMGMGLLDQEMIERGLPEAMAHGVAVIARGCFGGGLLKATADLPQLKGSTPKWQSILEFQRLSNHYNRSLLETALQFDLNLEAVTVTLLGMRTDHQLSENLQYAQAPPLSQVEMAALRKSRTETALEIS